MALAIRQADHGTRDLHRGVPDRHRMVWNSRTEFEVDAFARYIDGFYNPVRQQSSIGFQSPIAFERKAREVIRMLSTLSGQVHRRMLKV